MYKATSTPSSRPPDIMPKEQSADTIHGRFEKQARLTPGSVAVSSGEARLSYGELNSRAERLAGFLGAAVAGEAIGICVERSVDLVVAILGVLKTGAAYLPIDPGNPLERTKFMLADA